MLNLQIGTIETEINTNEIGVASSKKCKPASYNYIDVIKFQNGP